MDSTIGPINRCDMSIFASLSAHHNLHHGCAAHSTRTPANDGLRKHAQLHGHQIVAIVLHDVALLDRTAQVFPVVAAHARLLAVHPPSVAPPVGQESAVALFDFLDEALEGANAGRHLATHDAVHVDIAFQVVVIFRTHAVGVDEELVDVALGAAVQPCASAELCEWVRNIDIEILAGTLRGVGGIARLVCVGGRAISCRRRVVGAGIGVCV